MIGSFFEIRKSHTIEYESAKSFNRDTENGTVNSRNLQYSEVLQRGGS